MWIWEQAWNDILRDPQIFSAGYSQKPFGLLFLWTYTSAGWRALSFFFIGEFFRQEIIHTFSAFLGIGLQQRTQVGL